jgi:hypothetical protein
MSGLNSKPTLIYTGGSTAYNDQVEIRWPWPR